MSNKAIEVLSWGHTVLGSGLAIMHDFSFRDMIARPDPKDTRPDPKDTQRTNRTMQPKVSVIFPVGNRQVYLAEAIESILNQSMADFELLLILDGVDEEVQVVVDQYCDTRIRQIRMPINLGVSNARNAGLLMAQAPYVALMDSDDVAIGHRLAHQLEWLQANPRVTALGSNAIKLFEDGRRVPMVYPQTDGLIKSRLLLVDSALINATVMMRVDFLKHHAIRYDANFPRDQDHRFFVEMMRLGASFHCLQEELLLYRRHGLNATHGRNGVDDQKTRVRALVLPEYFPELTGHECRALLKGMYEQVQMNLDDACEFVAAVHKALRETRVFYCEDRDELRLILQRYLKRMQKALVSHT